MSRPPACTSVDSGRLPAPHPSHCGECDTATMRFFNTEGPIVAEDHYHVPPLARLDLDELLLLVERKKYFVLHAPRQTGKTSALLALQALLNGGRAGEYRCVYVNVEPAQAAREDVAQAMRAILDEMAIGARLALNDPVPREIWPEALERAGPYSALRGVLGTCAEADPRPLVLLIDEIDTLIGDTLLAVLRQLRAGYAQRPRSFPQSVVLCGVRDVRDYSIRSSTEKALIAGGSAFNVKAESLRLGDFSRDEALSLLAQHTGETGQEFTAGALETVWEQSQGQPWLVNALAYQACFRDKAMRDRARPVTAETIFDAREALIERRATHLEQLTDKLEEERVRRVVEPLLSGGSDIDTIPTDDLQYVRDLGLIRRAAPIAIANPVYREVIPRELTWTIQETMVTREPAWYVAADGRLLTEKLLGEFQVFFRGHSEHWVERFQYREAGPQLLLQAFLHRVVNGGGRVEREYGLGRMRVDLLVVWPVRGGRGVDGDEGGAGRTPAFARKVVIECKVVHGSLARTIERGLEQTREYMDRRGVEEGHLVVFDRTPGRSWEEKVFRREEVEDGAPVTVWGI